MRGPLHTYKMRRKWKHAQQVHANEHDAGVELSLSCEAVGHSWWVWEGKIQTDSYTEFFDQDAERHFLREYRGSV